MFCYGTPDRVRTCDLRFGTPVLYPAELRAHTVLAACRSLRGKDLRVFAGRGLQGRWHRLAGWLGIPSRRLISFSGFGDALDLAVARQRISMDGSRGLARLHEAGRIGCQEQ